VGAVLAERGELDRGLGYLEQSYRAGRTQGRPYASFTAAASAARGLRLAGRLPEARRWCELALLDERAEPSGAQSGIGRIEIEQAAIQLLEGDAAGALEAAERGLARVQSTGDLAHAPMGLEACARARMAIGDSAGALSLLDDFDSLLRRTELRPPIDAIALRDELSRAANRLPPPTLAGVTRGGSLDELTDRELEILTHAGAGLSNQAIGRALHISVATVKTHMHRAMHKLQARNRTAATHRARQLGLIA
jgi:ATP/maltotriose-dependent transcriptional regulator MalT